MESATTERNKHTDSSDKSVADQQPSLADVDIKVSKTVVTTSSDEEFFEKRVTRAQYKQLAAASDSESDGPNIRGASQANPKSNSALNSSQDMKANNKATALKGKEECSGDIDSLGDYVHVQVGDCVMMDSGDPDDPYVALVSSIQTSQRHDRAVSSFMAQWYYKPYDVKEEVKALIKGGVLENEVFLSPHKDRNSIEAVIEICQVVSPHEYIEIRDEIKRGFREKGKMYYVCRYKYYPNRSNIKKALEVVENEAIRNGLGCPKPNVGASYQANIPEFIRPAPIVSSVDVAIVPWKSHEDPAVRPRHMWSPLAAKLKSQTFMQFRDLVDTLKFAVGNIVKTYRSDAKPMGHQRGIVLQYFLSDSIQICASTGQVLTILKSEVCSPLSEDLALQHLYLSRFNLSQAAYGCSKTILHAQRKERKAFRNEVELFVKAKAKVAAATRGEESSHEDSRKRKK
ncbi:hypothetical protein KXD40_000001 [Peronospora effusa]|uniref:BAH domain-containing protein n=1 Tax=Peronospora effusa TaxID=542832 RepID=A0A3M6VIS6_9STRA|nr:hypothetical protein DD238_006608 [Peronospora effusa]RQM11628.1 hypothetical protein DD237_004550 [Peronospora effusa]UIZ20944.1 hypothetical protein KXD40_000001 [Peronospora effusa]CAI5705551.1 unnamed protein product [Peronospora effusa]